MNFFKIFNVKNNWVRLLENNRELYLLHFKSTSTIFNYFWEVTLKKYTPQSYSLEVSESQTSYRLV